MDLDFSQIEHRLNEYCSPANKLIAVYLLGTSAITKKYSNLGDIDFLFVVNDCPGQDFLIKLGRDFRLALKDIFENKKIFIFNSPNFDRPDIFDKNTVRIHLLIHKMSWVKHSLSVNNWVFTCWSNKNKLIVGQQVLNPITPVLNLSLIDEFDGLPKIIQRIEFSIFSYDITQYQEYFKKLYRYSAARYNDIVQSFPEIKEKPLVTKKEELYKEDLIFLHGQLETLVKLIKSKLDERNLKN